MDESKLSKRVLSGEIIGVSKFNKGDFALLVKDFMTYHENPKDRKVISPKGTKVWIQSVGHDSSGYHVWVHLANDLIGGHRVIEDLDILEPYEPDEFDRAWLLGDYNRAREIYDGKE